MSSLEVSRRRVMTLLAASIVTVPAVASAATRSGRGPALRTSPSQSAPDGSALLAPLTVGARLGTWRVERISPVRHGAVTVGLREDAAEVFYLDICARDSDPGAPAAPGRSDRFEVFVANLGNGSQPTDERQGLAAMAVADVLRTNEHRVSVQGILTLRERLSRHADKLQRSV